MTFEADCINYTRLAARWAFGLAMAALGAYIIVEKIGVWPGIGVLTFGVFILRPADLQAFAQWFRANAGSFIKPPSAP